MFNATKVEHDNQQQQQKQQKTINKSRSLKFVCMDECVYIFRSCQHVT